MDKKFYMSETRLGKQGVELVVSLLYEGKYDRIEKSELFQQILAEERALDLLKVVLQDFSTWKNENLIIDNLKYLHLN